MKAIYKLVLFTGIFSAAGTISRAQTEEDALRYSMLTPGTTARSLSIGGAAGSLGADFSAASVNPAGLALYRQSELTFTPSLRINGAKGSYYNNEVNDSKTQLTINNLGYVVNYSPKGKNYKESKWKSITLAVGFNRLADFNDKITYSGINNESSFSEVFAESAQNNGVDESYGPYGYLGYQGYLLTDDLHSIPYQNIIAQGGSLNQTKITKSSGHVNEASISLGANYNEKLMLGASIGITSYRFKRSSDFIEKDNTGNLNNGFNYFTFNETLLTTGVGVNAKLGVIYAVNDHFRLGAAIHTPTYIAFTDAADYRMVSDMENGSIYDVMPQNIYQYDYTLRTPLKAVGSATIIIGNKGFITADYEFVPYNTMHYKFKGYEEVSDDLNASIKENFKGASNVRIGGELRITPAFSGRLGAAFYGNPYTNENKDYGGNRLDLSAGVGYRFKNRAFIDFAYVFSKSSYGEYPYIVSGAPVDMATINLNKSIAALTLGFKF